MNLSRNKNTLLITGIIVSFVIVAIILWGHFTCWNFIKQCPSKSEDEQLEELNKDTIKENEQMNEELSEDKLCNFQSIKDVTPSPDKDGDGSYDEDESIPCNECKNYTIDGTKMTPFIKETVVYSCINPDEDDDICLKKQETVLDEIGICRPSLI